MPAPSTLPDLSQYLAGIIGTLQKMIAARAGRDRNVVATVLLAWSYLHRLTKRFESLARRVRTGHTTARPAGTGPGSATRRVRPPRPPTARLPTGFAWLIRLAPETAQLGGQVRHFLADPEFSALLAAAPQAGRILRPLCRMFGIQPDPDLPPSLFKPPARPARPPATVPETSAARLPALERPPLPPRAPSSVPRRRARPWRHLFSPA